MGQSRKKREIAIEEYKQKAKLKMTLEEPTTFRPRVRDGRSILKNKTKTSKKKEVRNPDASELSISPSEMKQQRKFERGIKMLKHERGDSMDSLNAARLRKLLDPEVASAVSRVSRQKSVSNLNIDKTYDSKGSLTERPKSA